MSFEEGDELLMLILSSLDFVNQNSKKTIVENLPRPLSQCKVLFFPNEKATHELMSRKIYHSRLMDYGFSRENITVFDYDNPSGFDNLNIDCIFISGGNTFGTIQKIRASSADTLITDYVKNTNGGEQTMIPEQTIKLENFESEYMNIGITEDGRPPRNISLLLESWRTHL